MFNVFGDIVTRDDYACYLFQKTIAPQGSTTLLGSLFPVRNEAKKIGIAGALRIHFVDGTTIEP